MRNPNGPGEAGYVVLRGARRTRLREQILVLKVMGRDRRGAFFGYAKDISAGGMFIASVNPQERGSEVDIHFTVGRGGEEIRCRSVVVWKREYDPLLRREPGMGIKFIDIDEAARERIKTLSQRAVI